VLLWGYSEGGRCAAWAAELQPSYAPEVNLRGVAAGGVPADLRTVAKAIDGGPFSGLGLAVLIGLAHAHQDPALDAVLSERGRAAAAHAATLDVVGLIVDHPEPMRHHTVRDEPWDEPVWLELLDRERNGRLKPKAPVYLYHVVDDQLVPTELGRQLHADYAALGAHVRWTEVVAEEHLSGLRRRRRRGGLAGCPADPDAALTHRVLWPDRVPAAQCPSSIRPAAAESRSFPRPADMSTVGRAGAPPSLASEAGWTT
jgi:Secretory lipase